MPYYKSVPIKLCQSIHNQLRQNFEAVVHDQEICTLFRTSPICLKPCNEQFFQRQLRSWHSQAPHCATSWIKVSPVSPVSPELVPMRGLLQATTYWLIHVCCETPETGPANQRKENSQSAWSVAVMPGPSLQWGRPSNWSVHGAVFLACRHRVFALIQCHDVPYSIVLWMSVVLAVVFWKERPAPIG